MWINSQFSLEFFKFTKKILNGKVHFFCTIVVSDIESKIIIVAIKYFFVSNVVVEGKRVKIAAKLVDIEFVSNRL